MHVRLCTTYSATQSIQTWVQFLYPIHGCWRSWLRGVTCSENTCHVHVPKQNFISACACSARQSTRRRKAVGPQRFYHVPLLTVKESINWKTYIIFQFNQIFGCISNHFVLWNVKPMKKSNFKKVCDTLYVPKGWWFCPSVLHNVHERQRQPCHAAAVLLCLVLLHNLQCLSVCLPWRRTSKLQLSNFVNWICILQNSCPGFVYTANLNTC